MCAQGSTPPVMPRRVLTQTNYEETQRETQLQGQPRTEPKHHSLASRMSPNGMVSDLTASRGDFEDPEEEEYWPIGSPLPRGGVSSLTASLGDFDDPVEEEKDDQRWGKEASHQQWVPMQQSRRYRSSGGSSRAGGSSLEVISELSEMSFVETTVEDETYPTTPSSSDRKAWSSDEFKTKPSVGLCMPKRGESLMELVTTDMLLEDEEDSSFDRMEAVAAPPSDTSTDTPVRVPTRRLSPTYNSS